MNAVLTVAATGGILSGVYILARSLSGHNPLLVVSRGLLFVSRVTWCLHRGIAIGVEEYHWEWNKTGEEL